MGRTFVISAVRDFAMHDRCVAGNPHVSECECVPLDNSARNDGIGICYNRFLASRPRDDDAWYVFCHEDFEFLEPPPARLEGLDRDSLWGPIGAATQVIGGLYHRWRLLGQVEECAKDGTSRHLIGCRVPKGTPVETFDCQCLTVHSSLVQRLGLRFDEVLTFDLYAEDFCIAAHEKAGVVSRILPLKARHWSGGRVLPRYHEQEAYLGRKFPNACYTGTSSWSIGGAPPFGRRLTASLKTTLKALLGRSS